MIVKVQKNKEEQQFIELFREHLSKSYKVLYIDFAKVSNMRDIAKIIFVQLRLLFENYIDEELNESLRFWEQKDDHKFLDAVLKVSQKIIENSQLSRSVFWSESYTDVDIKLDANTFCFLMSA